jgi:hypothetical protein
MPMLLTVRATRAAVGPHCRDYSRTGAARNDRMGRTIVVDCGRGNALLIGPLIRYRRSVDRWRVTHNRRTPAPISRGVAAP